MKQVAQPYMRLVAALNNTLISSAFGIICLYFVSVQNEISAILTTFMWVFVLNILTQWTLTFVQIKLISQNGADIGKILCKMQIVSHEGTYLNLKRAAFRWLIGPVISMTFLGLGYFWIFKDEKRRGWHDMAVGSIVMQIGNPIPGILACLALIIINAFLITVITVNVVQRIPYYRQIIQDIVTEIRTPLRNPNLAPKQEQYNPEMLYPTFIPTQYSTPSNTLR